MMPLDKSSGRKNLAVFVSGSGTNLQAIMDACDSGELFATVSLVVADNDSCFALKRAEAAGVETFIQDKKQMRLLAEVDKQEAHQALLKALKSHQIDLVVLAGYLSLIDQSLVTAYPKGIINLHPALIPLYCGKSYYGDKVHREVLANGETESGITIHFVDGGFDTGEIILQKKVPVYKEDTVETLSSRIHALEHEELKQVIKKLLI